MKARLCSSGKWWLIGEDNDDDEFIADTRIVEVPEDIEDIDAYLCQLHDEEEEAFCRVMQAFASACTRSTT